MAKAIIMSGGGGGIDPDGFTAEPKDVLEGMVAGVKGSDEPGMGTMPNKTGTTQSATVTLDNDNKRVQMTIPAEGKYSTSSKLYATFSAIASLIGLAADKLWPGITVLGIKSSRQSMAGGTKTPSTTTVTVACNGKGMTSDIKIPAFTLPPADKLIRGYKYTLYNKSVLGTAVYAGDIPGYLYEPPKEYEEITGGWRLYPEPGKYTITRDTDGFLIVSEGWYNDAGSCINTYNQIDFTPYRFMYLDYEATIPKDTDSEHSPVEFAFNVGRSDSVESSVPKSHIEFPKKGTYSGTMKLDVSNYNSEHYLGIFARLNTQSMVGIKFKVKAVRYDKIS